MAAHAHGTPGDDTVTVHAGETFNGGAGDDTITIVPSVPPLSLEPARVLGGAGNDTIIDESQSRLEFSFPVTINGGAGDDVIVATGAPVSAGSEVFTGGPGHDLFEFSIATSSIAHVITDFSRHDAIQIDSAPLSVSFTDNGSFTEVVAVFQQFSGVVLDLDGHFDPALFHTTDDGAGHTIITYGNSDFLLS